MSAFAYLGLFACLVVAVAADTTSTNNVNNVTSEKATIAITIAGAGIDAFAAYAHWGVRLRRAAATAAQLDPSAITISRLLETASTRIKYVYPNNAMNEPSPTSSPSVSATSTAFAYSSHETATRTPTTTATRTSTASRSASASATVSHTPTGTPTSTHSPTRTPNPTSSGSGTPNRAREQPSSSSSSPPSSSPSRKPTRSTSPSASVPLNRNRNGSRNGQHSRLLRGAAAGDSGGSGDGADRADRAWSAAHTPAGAVLLLSPNGGSGISSVGTRQLDAVPGVHIILSIDYATVPQLRGLSASAAAVAIALRINAAAAATHSAAFSHSTGFGPFLVAWTAATRTGGDTAAAEALVAASDVLRAVSYRQGDVLQPPGGGMVSAAAGGAAAGGKAAAWQAAAAGACSLIGVVVLIVAGMKLRRAVLAATYKPRGHHLGGAAPALCGVSGAPVPFCPPPPLDDLEEEAVTPAASYAHTYRMRVGTLSDDPATDLPPLATSGSDPAVQQPQHADAPGPVPASGVVVFTNPMSVSRSNGSGRSNSGSPHAATALTLRTVHVSPAPAPTAALPHLVAVEPESLPQVPQWLVCADNDAEDVTVLAPESSEHDADADADADAAGTHSGGSSTPISSRRHSGSGSGSSIRSGSDNESDCGGALARCAPMAAVVAPSSRGRYSRMIIVTPATTT